MAQQIKICSEPQKQKVIANSKAEARILQFHKSSVVLSHTCFLKQKKERRLLLAHSHCDTHMCEKTQISAQSNRAVDDTSVG